MNGIVLNLEAFFIIIFNATKKKSFVNINAPSF